MDDHARDELARATREFTDAFNRNDLDSVLSHFAQHKAVYEQFDGRIADGLEAIRDALVPQFRGDFGEMKFLEEDAFVDPEQRKTLIRWRCTLDTRQGPASWRGLDILHFDADGKIRAKLTYAKAKKLALENDPG